MNCFELKLENAYVQFYEQVSSPAELCSGK